MPRIIIENVSQAYKGQIRAGTTEHEQTEQFCLLVEEGVIRDIAIGATAPVSNWESKPEDIRLDADDLLISAGFIDVYARLRDPGFEKKATIESETRAAAMGGLTTLFCTPDTDPVIDEAATVELINRKSRDAGFSRVLPLAAATRGLEGEHLSELATLTAAGCIAATNADRPINNMQVVRRLMDYARTFDIVLILTAADAWLTGNGCAHEGATASRLGIPAIPVAAETVSLAMLIELAWQTGARVHFSRLSSMRGVEMIAAAKKDGLDITADTSINHLFLDDSRLASFDTQCRSVVPFRSLEDREALREAVSNGTIDVICSDHAPHEIDAKLAPFPSAAPGLSSLDAFLPLLLQLHEEHRIQMQRLLECVTTAPATIFGLEQGTLAIGKPADIILVDRNEAVQFEAAGMLSKGKNSPFLGQQMRGRVKNCVVEGRLPQATSIA